MITGNATAIRFGNDIPLLIYYDTGKTANTTYTPTPVYQISANGALTIGYAGSAVTATGILLNLAGDNIFSIY